ncbi:hypothetical protein DFA_09323 [Cavenderia fasciculata]|uniref:Transmembrane protein n=1 Tax=Cavenderia fasciculata TaxID=261658 RepID=F4Q7B1_CACFS|nr:uncharacterized protein DFA_09323 [Cavenderia fasciculata]EGG16293.1 hypothetical protein DFA_09323 [Cavenderia fasciculata]|eukprot:XP_004354677.1 hypothetical protein DFA_09323 [Cavenderia fasciculata]
MEFEMNQFHNGDSNSLKKNKLIIKRRGPCGDKDMLRIFSGFEQAFPEDPSFRQIISAREYEDIITEINTKMMRKLECRGLRIAWNMGAFLFVFVVGMIPMITSSIIFVVKQKKFWSKLYVDLNYLLSEINARENIKSRGIVFSTNKKKKFIERNDIAQELKIRFSPSLSPF